MSRHSRRIGAWKRCARDLQFSRRGRTERGAGLGAGQRHQSAACRGAALNWSRFRLLDGKRSPANEDIAVAGGRGRVLVAGIGIRELDGKRLPNLAATLCCRHRARQRKVPLGVRGPDRFVWWRISPTVHKLSYRGVRRPITDRKLPGVADVKDVRGIPRQVGESHSSAAGVHLQGGIEFLALHRQGVRRRSGLGGCWGGGSCGGGWWGCGGGCYW